MCWIQEPNSENIRLVVHDEYCYEMGCLNPTPAYTLQDLVVKLKAEVYCFDPETIEEYPSVKNTPWMFRVYSSKQPMVTESFTELGATPLLAGYAAYLTFLKPKKE